MLPGRSRSAYTAEELRGDTQSRKMVIRYRTRLIVLLIWKEKTVYAEQKRKERKSHMREPALFLRT